MRVPSWPSTPTILASLGGAVFALTAPPTDLYPAVVVGLALLAASIHDETRFGRAFGRGVVWGTSAGLLGLRFVPIVIQRFTDLGIALSLLALLLLSLAQSLIWGAGAVVAVLLHRRAHVAFAIAFGAGVLVALSLPTIFLWSPAGLVSPWPAFVQLADLVGERGVSVLFAIGAASFARAAFLRKASPRNATRHALVGLAIFVLLPLHGALRMASIARASAALPTLRVGLVDPSVPPRDRWNQANYPAILQTLRAETAKVEAEGADLTVWPEAAYPYTAPHDQRVAFTGRRAIVGKDAGAAGTHVEVRGPLLVGLITTAAPERLASGQVEQNSFNSATLVTPDGWLAPPTDKLQLLWFGEMVPLGAELPWLRRMFQRSGGLVPGAAPRAQELATSASGAPATRMAVLNCYEDTLPDLGRRVTQALEPALLVNVTNDAWFFATPEPELHARLAAMRAIELRLDLVRAVNMGVSSWIDARGVVRAEREEATPGTLLVTPSVRPPTRTIYARVGDAPAFVSLGLLAAVFVWRERRAKRAREGGASPRIGGVWGTRPGFPVVSQRADP